jgi:nuclear pore complex protein Nup88
MIPSQKDNYGDNSCSLLVIPTLPPTLVIAENSGMLHHILMIETPKEDSSFDETKTLLRNDWDLYVLETIELELGLSEDKTKDSSETPVSLKRDPVNEQRYFCYHDTGLHGITIGFVQQLQTYVNDESEVDPNLNVKSRAEYILSTKAFHSSKVNAIAGVGLLQSPSGIFAILSSGQVVSLNTMKLSLSVIPDLNATPPSIDEQQKVTSDRKIPFDQHIKSILNAGVSQPILKLDKSKPPSSQQAFELLMNSFQVMRDNQFKRHDQVRQEIAKRSKILELMKNQQKDEIAQLFEDKEMIQEKAYKLADMHEDIMERQQDLQKRVQDILRLASLRLPSGNSSEKEFAEQIKRIKSKTDKLLQDVRQIKSKHEIQKSQLENWESSNEDSIKNLPPKQEETIKEILVDMTKQIAGLTKDVQKINSIIDV